MTRADNGKLHFGVAEWIGILALVVGPMGTYGSWLWQQSDRVLRLEERESQTRATLEKIEHHVDLIPRIDQRLMAIESAAARQTAAAK